jgi:hypothetical protein
LPFDDAGIAGAAALHSQLVVITRRQPDTLAQSCVQVRPEIAFMIVSGAIRTPDPTR